MKNLFTNSLLFLGLVILIGCQTPTAKLDEDTASKLACDIGRIQISTNFPTGRLGECERQSETEFTVTLVPENTPINSSPWYAFKVTAEE